MSGQKCGSDPPPANDCGCKVPDTPKWTPPKELCPPPCDANENAEPKCCPEKKEEKCRRMPKTEPPPCPPPKPKCKDMGPKRINSLDDCGCGEKPKDPCGCEGEPKFKIKCGACEDPKPKCGCEETKAKFGCEDEKPKCCEEPKPKPKCMCEDVKDPCGKAKDTCEEPKPKDDCCEANPMPTGECDENEVPKCEPPPKPQKCCPDTFKEPSSCEKPKETCPCPPKKQDAMAVCPCRAIVLPPSPKPACCGCSGGRDSCEPNTACEVKPLRMNKKRVSAKLPGGPE